jgi:hypothetical protein
MSDQLMSSKIRDAHRFADKAIRQSYIEAKASRFKAWITEPVVVYKIHLIATTLLLATFIGYELMIYPLS